MDNQKKEYNIIEMLCDLVMIILISVGCLSLGTPIPLILASVVIVMPHNGVPAKRFHCTALLVLIAALTLHGANQHALYIDQRQKDSHHVPH